MNCHVNNDEPDIDLLLLPERQRLLEKLVGNIRTSTPPVVFGVHGDWGAGKTSFLQAVMKSLTGSCPSSPELPSKEELKANPLLKKAPVAVWFEAWRYQHETAPVIALLHQIRTQLSIWAKTKDVVKEVGLTVWRNFMLAFDSIVFKIESEVGLPGVEVAPFQMAKALEATQKARFTTPLPSNQIRDALDEVLKGLLGDGNRIVIFIDDLDRCSSAAMFSLLESIKIYLNLKHCVFVLGINRHELERNIASILPEPILAEQRHVRAHEYIEKLCGNITRLPYPTRNAQSALVNKWLGGLDDSSREDLVDLVRRHNFLPLNPRRVKMWCNTVLQLFSCRLEELNAAPEKIELPALAAVAAVHTFYPALHQALATAPSFIDALTKWCQATQRFDPDLEVFGGVQRVFVNSVYITAPSHLELEAVADFQKNIPNALEKFESARTSRLESLKPILERAYGWNGRVDADKKQEKSAEPADTRIPLIKDPSSLHYFHPQPLLADELITEELVRPYLHLD